MFTFRRPNAARLEQLRAAHRNLPLTYAEVGHTRTTPPPGYVVDHNRVALGNGVETFRRACQALTEWRMLRLGWLEPCWPEAGLAEGELVGTLASLFGLAWTANVCRIVYVIDEATRFGFAYGTLRGHVMHGEERFLVELLPDGWVWFDILAFSRPARWPTRLGYPVVRWFQRRFARAAKAAIVRAVRGESPPFGEL